MNNNDEFSKSGQKLLNTEATRHLCARAATIKLLLLDVDGILTDGRIWLTADGNEYKTFHTQDGYGLKRLQQSGVTIAILSGRNSPIVDARMRELGIHYCFQGLQDKLPTYLNLLDTLNIDPSEAAYMGDDIPDLIIMQRVGFSITVPNAVPAVKKAADWQTQQPGGYGAVREACDLILAAQQQEQLAYEQ